MKKNLQVFQVLLPCVVGQIAPHIFFNIDVPLKDCLEFVSWFLGQFVWVCTPPRQRWLWRHIQSQLKGRRRFEPSENRGKYIQLVGPSVCPIVQDISCRQIKFPKPRYFTYPTCLGIKHYIPKEAPHPDTIVNVLQLYWDHYWSKDLQEPVNQSRPKLLIFDFLLSRLSLRFLTIFSFCFCACLCICRFIYLCIFLLTSWPSPFSHSLLECGFCPLQFSSYSKLSFGSCLRGSRCRTTLWLWGA